LCLLFLRNQTIVRDRDNLQHPTGTGIEREIIASALPLASGLLPAIGWPDPIIDQRSVRSQLKPFRPRAGGKLNDAGRNTISVSVSSSWE